MDYPLFVINIETRASSSVVVSQRH